MSEILNNIFEGSKIQFEEINVNSQLIPTNLLNSKFGIFNLKTISSSINTDIIYDFIFMIDCSGSMSDKCSDGRTKMQHICVTLKNMINYFYENQNLQVYISIYVFNSKTSTIIERTLVNCNSFNIIMLKIDHIIANDMTNIELALQQIKKTVDYIKKNFKNHSIINIFMTDGEITDGKADANYLSTLVDRTITNAFIGFGILHDSTLLNSLSNGLNSNYYFIDKLENSGLIYGEILHGIIYKLLYDVEISIDNGLIYDFKNNNWITNLIVGDVFSEANKIFHIISNNPLECIVNINAKKCRCNKNLSLNILCFDENINMNLTKYKFRQRTLQNLFIVKEFMDEKNKNVDNYSDIFTYSNSLLNNSLKEKEINIKKILFEFMEEIQKYINENNLKEDKFLKNLCDDIYISYRNFNSFHGNMYVNSRHLSQGTQRCYTVGNDSLDEEKTINYNIPKLKLQRNNPNLFTDEFNDEFIFENKETMQHEISDFNDSPYLNPIAENLMREISSQKKLNLNENNHS
jgi:uncharacterized protein YegL